jgi:pimeloyl-ACP methyl ester carboxylesterase
MTAIVERSAAGLCYLVRDGQTPIVLLHGIGSNAQSFTPLMGAFDDRYCVLAWNAPGYDRSAPLEPDWPDASDYAAALDRLLAEVGIGPCVLAGHSLGALIAARFARLKPDRVNALVLISPALGYAVKKGAALPPAVAKRIEELDALGAQEFAAARAPGLLADPAARPDVLASVEAAMADVRRPGYDQAARLLAVGRLLEDAAELDVSTLVLVGAQDRITPPANVRRAFDALRKSASHLYREIADAGHALCQEQPVLVAHAIEEFAARKASAHA